nr:MAG TPA: hypothetical protein [Caudoviricetes sp.]
MNITMENFDCLVEKFLALPQNKNKVFEFRVIDGVLYYRESWW